MKITLQDGTVLDDLKLNGNNYISQVPISDDVFKGNLGTVTVTDEDTETVYTDMKLIQNIEFQGEYWFILAEKTEQDRLNEFIAQQRADIDYLAIMSEVEL